MTKTDEQGEEEQNTLKRALVSFTTVVWKWIADRVILGVVDEEGEQIGLEESDIIDWALHMRMIVRKNWNSSYY